MLGMFTGSSDMWYWATNHPYLFTFIKISTPTMLVILMYAASKIIGVTSRKRR